MYCIGGGDSLLKSSCQIGVENGFICCLRNHESKSSHSTPSQKIYSVTPFCKKGNNCTRLQNCSWHQLLVWPCSICGGMLCVSMMERCSFGGLPCVEQGTWSWRVCIEDVMKVSKFRLQDVSDGMCVCVISHTLTLLDVGAPAHLCCWLIG